jgi:hypothetical protein
MLCPHCHALMTAEVLEAHLGTSVTIDLCLPCQVFWFDAHESLKLAPRGVLKLFRTIGDRPPLPPAPRASHPTCPRCRAGLLATFDQQRNTRFQYLRCPKDHGRLIAFVEFLREKAFIRPLTPQQIRELRQSVQTLNCSSCGAPIDLASETVCGHCGAALSMLDMKQAGALVAQLQEADRTGRPIDPALPLELARARREVEAAFASFEHGSSWFGDVSSGGLVSAGLSALSRWLKSRS